MTELMTLSIKHHGYFETTIDPAEVDECLRSFGVALDETGGTKQDVQVWILDHVGRESLSKEDASALATALVWLACTTFGNWNDLMARMAKEGGRGLHFEVDDMPNGVPRFSLGVTGDPLMPMLLGADIRTH